LLLRQYLLDSGAPADVALACTLAGALGSLSLTYGQMFAGHQMAAVALGAAFLAGFWKEKPALLGFFCALAVALEYPAAPAALILFGGFLLHRRRGFVPALLGAIPPSLVIVRFHWAGVGAPWPTRYRHLDTRGFLTDF